MSFRVLRRSLISQVNLNPATSVLRRGSLRSGSAAPPARCLSTTVARNGVQPSPKRIFHSSAASETETVVTTSVFSPLDTFARRHVGPSPSETEKMLKTLNYNSLDDFVRDVLPENILSARNLRVEPSNGFSESELIAQLKLIAKKNKLARSYIGCGYAGTITPPVIQRNVLETPEWYTSYTPYQPEISQGIIFLKCDPSFSNILVVNRTSRVSHQLPNSRYRSYRTRHR